MPFYAVRVGQNPGIYSSWEDCEKQVKGFPNARYKKFNTKDEAFKFIVQTDTAVEKQSIPKPQVQKREQDSSLQDEERNSKRVRYEATPENSAKKTNDAVSHDAKTSNSFSFNNEEVIVYTDGACSNNGRESASAGIGVYFGPNHPLNVSRKLAGNQTNNRAEITAAIVAIEVAISHKASGLTIYTDSKFMINCIESWIKKWKQTGWKTSKNEDVKNIEDLKKLDSLCSKFKVKWQYVPGHKGVAGNEEADKLARDAVLS